MGKLTLWFLKKKEILNKKLGLGQTPPPLLGLCPKYLRFFLKWLSQVYQA